MVWLKFYILHRNLAQICLRTATRARTMEKVGWSWSSPMKIFLNHDNGAKLINNVKREPPRCPLLSPAAEKWAHFPLDNEHYQKGKSSARTKEAFVCVTKHKMNHPLSTGYITSSYTRMTLLLALKAVILARGWPITLLQMNYCISLTQADGGIQEWEPKSSD